MITYAIYRQKLYRRVQVFFSEVLLNYFQIVIV